MSRFPKKHVGEQPIIHRSKHVKRIWPAMLADGSLYKAYCTPNKLTVLTTHNHDVEPILETNLKWLGIDYTVLRETRIPFKYVYKIERMLTYLTTATVRTPYVLFIDADDAIVIDSLDKVIDIFESKQCDLLFGCTMFKGGWGCMPEVYAWYLKHYRRGHYLNSGVYIGTWDFLIEVLTEAMKYVTVDSMTVNEYKNTGMNWQGVSGKLPADFRLCHERHNFPKGSTEQLILRYIHPKFHPRMQVDIKNEIAYRN